MFKNVFYWVVILVAFSYLGYSVYLYTLNPCDKPIQYSIGRFDTEFGISQAEFLNHVAKAESVWENALSKNVFIYNPDSSFTINLVYDDRQLATILRQKTESGLAQAEAILTNLDTQFTSLKNSYERELASQNQAITSFESRQKEYESKVDYWNKRGGAPKNEYEALKQEAETLNAEALRLNGVSDQLNDKSKELNTILKRRNEAAVAYNNAADNYNDRYGGGLEFDQAEYTGEEINVYQFGNRNDLTTALTHELGHALGMDHVDTPDSLMYYLTNGAQRPSLTPSEKDLEELNKVCPK